MAAPAPAARQRGVTLVETILVIVLGGTIVAGIAGALAFAAAHSADAWPMKQALSVAESVVGEIAMKPFTSCDADGPAPPGSAVCAIANASGPEAGESRTSYATPFDHPDDYDGFTMSGITRLDGTAVGGLGDYAASASVQPQALDGILATEGIWISVTVTGPGGASVRLQAFQARYAP